jgi:hypothetical protein
VQYNASVSQPMARNIGEAMGVGAKYAFFDAYGKPLPEAERFRSSALIDSLDRIEKTLWKLQPPAWPADMLGAVDTALAGRGKTLFAENCQTCHGPHLAPEAVKKRNSPLKGANDPEWLIKTLCAADIGTDPNAAQNFDTVKVDITRTGMTAVQLRASARKTAELSLQRWTVFYESEIKRLSAFRDSAAALAQAKASLANLRNDTEQSLAQIDPKRLPMGAALSYLGTMIRENAYADARYTKEQQAALDGFGALDMPQVVNAYKSRPLAGIWATPPFLHNGSVPTIYDLISDPKQRPDTFRVGSREYDPKKLGLAVPPNPDKYMLFETKWSGNHNTGHEFADDFKPYLKGQPDPVQRKGVIGRKLKEDEKWAILEYLKIRDDDKDGSKIASVPTVCWDR